MFNDKIFIAGGPESAYVESYKEGDSAWNKLDSLKVQRENPHCFAFNNKLHVFGGKKRRFKFV